MVFNSLEFFLFLPIAFLFYSGVYKKENYRNAYFLIISYFFYMAWYWQYAGLIALSTIADFYIAKKIAKSSEQSIKRFYLTLSLILNLGLLALFKYFNFFSGLTYSAIDMFGISVEPFYMELLLPVGISFYTFQTLSYSIDVYRGELKPERKLIRFAVFVSFFPQLVAGPIVRAKDFLPQLVFFRPASSKELNLGLFLILVGLFKKIVIADLLGFLALDQIFTSPENYSSFDLVMGLYGYSIQIYCDFSGYSDIAIGVALLFGFKLPKNFDRPYLSQNPSEFWRRWHISLSSWLRDYLYISLGGNRVRSILNARNLLITMILGGLWHGAALNFLLWGLFHGLLLILCKNFRGESEFNFKKVVNIFVFYHVTLFGWLIFRVGNFDIFIRYVNGLLELSNGTQLSFLFFVLLTVGLLMHFLPKEWAYNRIKLGFVSSPTIIKSAIYSASILLFIGFSLTEPNFIYFQF